jgi:hypothetical protein
MKRTLRALIAAHNQRGQSLVELAISLTVMLLLLAGAVTFGMALFSYVAIRDAAQEGALFGSFNPYLDTSSPPNGKYDAGEPVNMQVICDRVKAASTSPVDMSGFSCTADGGNHAGNNIDVSFQPPSSSGGGPCEGVGGGTPNAIQVRVEYNYQVIMPFFGSIINSDHIHLNAVVTDTILQPRCSP